MDNRIGIGSITSGQAFATPQPVERPTDAIKQNLQSALALSHQAIGRIDKEQYRLTGPHPTAGMISENTKEEPPEGDLPELLYLARRLAERIDYIDARLQFLSEI